MATQPKQYAATVYPSRPGAFAPLTVFTYREEFAYMREVQQNAGKFGICSAPARSFTDTHPDTFCALAAWIANN